MSDPSARTFAEVVDELTEYESFDPNTALEQCPTCGRLYSANGGYCGPVFTTDGSKWEGYYETEPEDGPFVCGPCGDRIAVYVVRRRHRTLDTFSPDSGAVEGGSGRVTPGVNRS